MSEQDRSEARRTDEQASLVRSPAVPTWRTRAGGALFLVTGAALVVHILIGLPLWLTVLGGLGLAASAFAYLRPLAPEGFKSPLRVGLLAGAVGLVAYDSTRFIAVALLSFDMQPYEAWKHFGAALVGASTPEWAQWASGTLFHVVNGLAFAIAYTHWFAASGIRAGIPYALMLEVFMLGLYPGWLKIDAYLPFVVVSLIGHLAYGATVGALAKRWTSVASDA